MGRGYQHYLLGWSCKLVAAEALHSPGASIENQSGGSSCQENALHSIWQSQLEMANCAALEQT